MNRLLALCAALCAAALPAFTSAATPPANMSFGDWTVNTGEVAMNWQTGVFSTPVPVTMTRPGARIRADRANGNYNTHQAVLTGNVSLYDQTGSLVNFSGVHKPASLTCDTLQVDGTTKVYVATGRVHFSQGTSWASADRAVMNGNTHDLHLYGHVQLHQ